MGYVLKKNIVETGFIDKYIQSDNETFITLDNKKEFEALLEIRINELQKQYETEEQEEFEWFLKVKLPYIKIKMAQNRFLCE